MSNLWKGPHDVEDHDKIVWIEKAREKLHREKGGTKSGGKRKRDVWCWILKFKCESNLVILKQVVELIKLSESQWEIQWEMDE